MLLAEILYCLGTVIAYALMLDMKRDMPVPQKAEQAFWFCVLAWPLVSLAVMAIVVAGKKEQ